MEEKKQIDIDDELKELLEKEWFWLHNFAISRELNGKLTEEQIEHNEKQAQSLKEKLEEKYPNISLDIDTIKRLGIQYTKWTRKEESKRMLEEDREKYKEDQKKYSDWVSPGSVLDVHVNHEFLVREAELRDNKIESPMSELRVIVAASKVDPENLDMDILEYLRKRKLVRKVYKSIITDNI